MHLSQSQANLQHPEHTLEAEALSRTTHLGIGAHPDDLEFMALHGILQCYNNDQLWFGGVTCTNGSGSQRAQPYADYSDDAIIEARRREQCRAAAIGQYCFIAQLGHPSLHAREPGRRAGLVSDLLSILRATRPKQLYTHNPFDKHTTHLGVLDAVLTAVRQLPESERPETLLGCEVWRGLDWLPEARKLTHNVSSHPQLAAQLCSVYESQIAGGKRYDRAVDGRQRANATFNDAHQADKMERAQYAIDLTPLIKGVSMAEFMGTVLEEFKETVLQAYQAVSPKCPSG